MKFLVPLKISVCSSIFLSLSLSLVAQVGVNTIDPQTTLHVEGNPNAANSLDGLLVPRMTAAQLSAKTYTNNQNGTLVFITDTANGTNQAMNVSGIGVYYFDAVSGLWVTQAGGTVTGADGELEAVGNGYRIRGRNPALYVNPGNQAVDLSESNNNLPSGASGNTSFAVGRNTNASGVRSFAGGFGTTASQRESFAIGQATIASGRASFATGRNSTASGESSFAGGDQSSASQFFAFAYGFGPTASGNSSFAIGRGTEATGTAAMAIGNDTRSTSSNSFSGGDEAIASSRNSFAFGDATTASGGQSFALGSNTVASETNSVAAGSLSRAEGENAVAMGSSVQALADGTVALGSSVTVRANDTGSFYFGDASNGMATSTNTNRMHMRFANGYNFYTDVGATVGARLQPGGTAWTAISDRRSKKDIKPIPYGLSAVLQLEPTIYAYKDTDVVSMGFIAQDVQKIVSEVVDEPANKKGYMGIKYTELIPVLTKAIQEQQEIITTQQQKIENLEDSFEELKNALEKLLKVK